MNQTIYQVISYLLRYPNVQMVEALPEIRTELENIQSKQIKEKIHQFIDESESMSLDDWIHYYVDYFDFGRLTNLYVTYLKLGEQRERGLELLKLKKYYEAHGYDVTDKELPDYLPLMLEFCADVSIEVSNELLQMHAEAIAEIQNKLKESSSYYSLLFDALFLQIGDNGVTISAVEA